MRKALIIAAALLLTLPLTGCWDRKEVNDLALVMAEGVDLMDNNQIKVSVQVALPSQVGGSQSGSGKGESGKSFLVVSGRGQSIGEAEHKIQQKLPRQMYLPHLRVILVGNNMAKKGMDQILDRYGRNPPNRLRTAILVAKDSDALPLLTTTYPLESISSEAVRKLERQLLGVNTTLMDFLIQASSDGMDQFTSAISLSSESGSGSSDKQKEETKDFTFQNVAVFRDLKLVGYLNTPESIALQILNQRLRHVTLTFGVPKTNGYISVDLTQSKRRSQTLIKGNNVSVKYEISGSAMLTENTTGLDADDPVSMKMFQDALNRYIEQISKECLETLTTKFDSDAVGIGRFVYHQHPYDWVRLKKNWHEELKNVQFSVTSQAKIIENGKSGPPLYGKTHRGILQQNETSEQIGGGTE